MKPEMPKSFLVVILGLVVITIPLFFTVLFVGTARRNKRRRAVVQAELEPFVTYLRQRAEVVLETLRSAPGSAGEGLRQSAQTELELLQRFSPTPANLAQLSTLDAAMEEQFQPWFQSLPDSYGKRKLAPLQDQVSQARQRYNDAVQVCGKDMFPLLPGSQA